MVASAAGTVVLIRFPFSDLSQTKLRPAVVLASVARGDRILCQITSKPYGDRNAVEIKKAAFVSGSLLIRWSLVRSQRGPLLNGACCRPRL